MNVGKSIKVALAMRDMKQKELAEVMGVKPASVSQLASQTSCTGETLGKLAAAFGMAASEFIKLGED
jgi:plasmid maintenance system antidote protein VapI